MDPFIDRLQPAVSAYDDLGHLGKARAPTKGANLQQLVPAGDYGDLVDVGAGGEGLKGAHQHGDTVYAGKELIRAAHAGGAACGGDHAAAAGGGDGGLMTAQEAENRHRKPPKVFEKRSRTGSFLEWPYWARAALTRRSISS